jgi:hypothetical protein
MHLVTKLLAIREAEDVVIAAIEDLVEGITFKVFNRPSHETDVELEVLAVGVIIDNDGVGTALVTEQLPVRESDDFSHGV